MGKTFMLKTLFVLFLGVMVAACGEDKPAPCLEDLGLDGCRRCDGEGRAWSRGDGQNRST